MKIIRRGTFETNSSSTHSITMCKESDFDKWKNGELYFCQDNGKFYDEEGRTKIIKEQIIYNKKAEYNNGIYTYKGISVEYKDINQLYTEENLSEITEEEVQDYLENDFDYYEIPLTYEQWDDCFDYEKYEDSYKTDSGETIVAFGYYGMDC